HRLARQRDPAVDLEPMLFVLRRDFAHPPADGVLDSRLPLERRVDLQKTVIDRLGVPVEQDFDGAESLVDRIEQRAVSLFRFAQLSVDAPALGDVAPDALVTLEPALIVEDRCAANAEILDRAVRRSARKLELAEGLTSGEHCPVL